MGNYRPIAILPSFSKIFEKVLFNRITSFLELDNMLDNNQFGFRKGKNTALAIFKMLRQVWEEINNKKTGIALFLDLSMAFDCVSHTILLSKLEAAGIRGTSLSLLESYLQNRTQSTVIDVYNRGTKEVEHVMSDFESTTLGVPQGSILGPLLFLVYINELPKITKHLCVLFADDATIFIPQDNLNYTDFEAEVNKTLQIVTDWLGSINLKVNIDKTKILQFSNYKTLPLNLNILNEGNKISEITETNFLGVTLDNHLNWKAHINKINSRLTKYCYALSVLSNITSKSVAISAYYGYVYPQLSYGIIFWGNSVHVNSIFLMQKRCLRNIYNLDSTDTLRDLFKNNFLTVTCIYILELCHFVKTNEEHYFSKQSSRAGTLRTKHKYNMCIPQVNNTLFYKSTFVTSIKVFNHLPLELKTLQGDKFKNNLKKWLLTQTFYNLEEYFNTN